jgi:hypothetical protein
MLAKTVIGRGHKMHASACEFYTRLESQRKCENNGYDSGRQHQGATFYFTLPVVDMTELRMGEEKGARVVNDQGQ